MNDKRKVYGRMFPGVGKSVIINTKTRKPHLLNSYTEEYKKKTRINQRFY